MAAPVLSSVRSVALRCAVVAVLVGLVPVLAALEAADWHASGLVRMEAGDPIAPYALEGDPEFRFVEDAHYDGVYFYAIARDPFATGEAHRLIDESAYRYGHAGYGWLAGLFSLGRPGAVPSALMVLALVGLGVAAAGTSLLASELGWTPWAGLAVAFHPGLLYAATALTSETVGAALLVFTLWLWIRGRYGLASVALVGLCLVKEPFAVVAAGLALWELKRWLGARGDLGVLVQRVALLSIGPLAFVLWYVYLRLQFGEWSFEGTEGFFGFPVWSWLPALQDASFMARGNAADSQIGAVSAPLLAAVAAALVFGIFKAVRARTPVDPAFVLLALVGLSLQPIGVVFPKDLVRELAMPLLLLPLVLATPPRRERRQA